jgi:hypothetical protein
MNLKYTIPLMLALLLCAACQAQEPPESVDTQRQTLPLAAPSASPTATATPPTPERDQPSTAPESTPTLTAQPTHTLEPPLANEFVQLFCPQLSAPLGLFSLPEPFIDNSTDPPTVFTPYQIETLRADGSAATCLLYLSPGPMGDPQVGGKTLLWQSFDHEAESITVWQYGTQVAAMEDAYPQHSLLVQTTISTSIGKSGLADFVVSADGEMLAWSYTDPRVNENNELAYVQMIYAAFVNDPVDQRPVSEIWFDVVPETDGRPHIIRLRAISAEKDRIYFSDEPIGLGRQWPEPFGRYSSLYSISTMGNGSPEVHHDCGQSYWCISDFADELDLLIALEENTNAIQIKRLSDGQVIGAVQAPAPYNIVRQAWIGPTGDIIFMGVALDGSIFDAPAEDVAIFYSEAPYDREPVLVYSDPGLQNLLGWVSAEHVLADGRSQIDDQQTSLAMPTQLTLIDITDGSATWLPQDARNFVSALP